MSLFLCLHHYALSLRACAGIGGQGRGQCGRLRACAGRLRAPRKPAKGRASLSGSRAALKLPDHARLRPTMPDGARRCPTVPDSARDALDDRVFWAVYFGLIKKDTFRPAHEATPTQNTRRQISTIAPSLVFTYTRVQVTLDAR